MAIAPETPPSHGKLERLVVEYDVSIQVDGSDETVVCTVMDNPYSHRHDDDEEIVAILTAIIGVIEI